MSPECVQITYNFLKAISSLLPLVIIPGNHDININNRERLDSLTPIISDLPGANPIYYLLETGVYQISNLIFYHASIFDYQIIPPIKGKNTPFKSQFPLSHIMLYHGRVNGAILYNGLELTDDTNYNTNSTNSTSNTTSNKTITPSTFANYDITCLGDIHKHQFMTPNVAYAGSLIQQNLGEDVANHGLIKWDIETKRGIFIPIKNDWSYITLYVDNKKANHQCAGKGGIHDPECELSKNLRVRILYKNTPESFINDYITLLKMNHNVTEYSYQNDDQVDFDRINGEGNDANDVSDPNDPSNPNDSSNPNDPSSHNSKSSSKNGKSSNSIIDITSPELQNKFLIDYISQNEPSINQDQLKEIRELNIRQNELLKESNKDYSSQTFSGHYKLKRIEFSNLFSFGLNNVIDFTNFKGIVGIIAPNHLGKSAILDIIIFTLFDKFTRKGSTKDIVNIRSDFYNVKVDISIGQWTYTIVKSGSRNKTNTVSSKIEFYRINDIENITERLDEDTASKTKERITELFGCYEDIIHTSFSIQHDNSCFIDSENTERKKELQRIMRFDIIDKLGDMANSSLNKYKDIREHISKKINNDFIVETKKGKAKAEKNLLIHTDNKTYAKEKIKNLHENILTTSAKLNKECITFLEENEMSQEDTETILEDLSEQIDNSNKKIENQYKIIELYGKEPNQSTHFNLVNLKQSILDKEIEYTNVIKDANKKIRIIEQNIETLYKSRKPSNIKIPTQPTHPTPKEYLDNLHIKYAKQIAENTDKIKEIDIKITVLKEKEKQIEANNNMILTLEKQMIKLPDSLLELISDDTSLETKYKKAFIDLIGQAPNNIFISDKYKKYESLCRQLFLSQEISSYRENINSNEEAIVEQQNDLETLNLKLKTDMREIKTLETQIRQIEQTTSNIQLQIQQVETDLSNLESNLKIDGDIAEYKVKRVKYEKRIEDNEEHINNLKEQSRQIAKYETLLSEKTQLEGELSTTEETLIKFDKYKAQIDANIIIQKEIDSLKAELAEFEEVFEEIEKQYNIENTSLTKYNAKIDQLRKDIAENKAIENNLTLFTVYKKALKALPFLLLGKIQPLLEKKVNDLLSIMTDFTLKIDITDSKIDIYIDRSIYNKKTTQKGKYGSMPSSTSSNGPDRHILVNNASGFERFIASLAIRIALLDISNLPKINCMAIDEGWSAFDNTNLNNVSIILDYLKQKFDFILTISHLTEIKQHCDSQIGLRKDDNGYSKIIL